MNIYIYIYIDKKGTECKSYHCIHELLEGWHIERTAQNDTKSDNVQQSHSHIGLLRLSFIIVRLANNLLHECV